MAQAVQQLSRAKSWLLAVRPWAYGASIMPVLLGIALTFYSGHKIDWFLFAITLVGVVSFHTAANLLNDCFDHKRGLDVKVYPSSGAIVRGLLTEGQVFRAGLLFSVIGVMCGFYLVYISGWQVFALGVIGAVLALGYTSSGVCLKYAGFGDLAIFIAFGILPVFGTYWVQVQKYSWMPVLWSVPVASYTVGILHANNWRDMAGDSVKNCTTLAGLLGEGGSRLYYRMLVLGPLMLVSGLVLIAFVMNRTHAAPMTSLLVLLALPMGLKLISINRINDPGVFVMLDGKTAQMGMVFGLMLTLAFVVARLLERFN